MIDWKSILRGIIPILGLSIYTFIRNIFPDFPLQDNTFVDLIVWIIGILIGGWASNKSYHQGYFKQ